LSRQGIYFYKPRVKDRELLQQNWSGDKLPN